MIQAALKTTTRSTKNVFDWITLADHIIKAENTPFEPIYQEDIAQVRYYPPLDSSTKTITVGTDTVEVEHKRYQTPIVIVAPLAVNMYIYDLFPERSLVKYLNAKGFKVYMVDWGSPTIKNRFNHLSTYFAEMMPRMLDKVRQHSGSQQLSLHGWSLGGLFSYCYTALTEDKDIKNIVLLGAPCDYHANGDVGKLYQSMSKQLHWAEKRFDWNVYQTGRKYWHFPGWVNAVGFKLTNPVNSVKGYVDLIKNINDREFVSNHATNAAFLDRMEAYPGGVLQDIAHYLCSKNVLAKGQLPMEGTPELINKVSASVLSITSKQDTVVDPACTSKLFDIISSEDVTQLTVSGGHMGILGGSKAPETSWHQIADWLAERSGPLL